MNEKLVRVIARRLATEQGFNPDWGDPPQWTQWTDHAREHLTALAAALRDDPGAHDAMADARPTYGVKPMLVALCDYLEHG